MTAAAIVTKLGISIYRSFSLSVACTGLIASGIRRNRTIEAAASAPHGKSMKKLSLIITVNPDNSRTMERR